MFRRGLSYLQWHTSPGVLISRSCADCYKHMCSELRDEGERKGFEAAKLREGDSLTLSESDPDTRLRDSCELELLVR